MSRQRVRRSISVQDEVYRPLMVWCHERELAMASVVEALTMEHIGEPVNPHPTESGREMQRRAAEAIAEWRRSKDRVLLASFLTQEDFCSR